MKYFFEIDYIKNSVSCAGRYYEIVEGKLRSCGKINFNRLDDPVLKSAYICQLLAEGGRLPIILRDNAWSPPLIVFHAIIKEFPEVREWHEESLKIRETLVLENLYTRLSSINPSLYMSDDSILSALEATKVIARDLYNYYRKRDRSEEVAPVNVVTSLVKKFDMNRFK